MDQRYARPNIDRVPLLPVSRNAIDLITRLLDERHDRLSARRYCENDLVLRDRVLGVRSHRHVPSIAGHIVFPHDAEDIKSHPFFRNIQWSMLHMTRPPFVPRVHGGQPITKYFDEEADIMSASDHLDSSSYEVFGVAEGQAIPSTAARAHADDPSTPVVAQSNVRTASAFDPMAPASLCTSLKKIRKRKKEKKRPRDKLLRDAEVGRTVMEIRKKGAFIGYTYRRPRFSLLDLEDRLAVARPHVTRAGVIAASA